jgi:hypothetical protein
MILGPNDPRAIRRWIRVSAADATALEAVLDFHSNEGPAEVLGPLEDLLKRLKAASASFER